VLSKVIELSVRHRIVVIAASGLLVIAGLFALRELPFDAFPDTTPVQVSVNTVAPALSPEEIERQVTFPIEQSLGGLPGLREVRSVSKFGFSQVTVLFEDRIDIYLARQVVGERLQTVQLPDGVGKPALGPISTGLGEVFQYLVRSPTRSTMELRTLHEWEVRPQMLGVPGVAEINTWGGYEKQFQVVVDPDRLLKHELTLREVRDALRRNNANVGGGYALQGGEAQLVQGVGLATDERAIESIVVDAKDGVPIRIADIGRVDIGHAIRRGAVTAEGRGEAVLGLGFMLMGENSREVTAALERRLEKAEASLPDDVDLEPVYSRTELVDKVLRTVRNNLLEGGLLVIAVLFVFLGNLRAGLIVASAIPLSMLFAFDMMLRFGVAGSLMSLGAIDFGLVVDSSVIMVENSARRLSDDRTGRSVVDIVREAALEVRRPTLFGELIIVIVYLPILALEGYEGKLFRPMALTVIFALVGSMILSLTLMPALASVGLKRGKVRDNNWILRGLQRLYGPALEFCMRRRAWTLTFAALLVAYAATHAAQLGAEFVPRLREQAVVINTVRLSGVSLEESVRYGTELERLLKKEFPDEIAHIWTRTGTAEVATDPMGLEVSDMFITLTPRDDWTRASTQDGLVREMQSTLEDMPGMRTIFTQPIEMRMNEMIAGIRSDVGIKLFGDDFDVLRDKAADIDRLVRTIPGATGVTTEQITGMPMRKIRVDRDALARYGIPASEALALVESLGTSKVGELIRGQRRFDLVTRLDERYRRNPSALEDVLVSAPDGRRVPLSQLARFELVEGPSTVSREALERRITVEANVRDRDVASFVAEARRRIDDEIDLPSGYYVDFGGQFEHLEQASTRLAVVVPVALLLVFALLYLSFGRLRDALLVFTGVPFATVGGIAALALRGMPFSISAGVGFVALSGVSVLGQLVLVSQIRRLRERDVPLPDAVRKAAQTRLRPVLMTALVASLGFVPMALNTGVGAEVQRPLATVVVGGILTSTLATLVVLPVLYASFGEGWPWRRAAR
jgi:cobalt-zinc-cadmium resistance protein CzcA